MKRSKLLLGIISTLFIVIMISGTTQAVISPYVGVVIGEEFEYEITIFHIKQDLNNVNYININPFGMEGNKIKIKVADIVEEEQSSFLGIPMENQTKIKTTESFAGKTFESESFLDDWFETFFFLTFYYETSPITFNPETYEFNEPKPFNDSDENYEGLPVFASTNESYYQQLNASFSEPATFVPVKNEVERDSPFQLAYESYEVGYWPDKNEFYLNVSLYSSNTGTTSTDIGWDLNIGVDIVTHIDIANGLVKDLDYSINEFIAVGTNSSLMKARQAFKKVGGGRPTITLDYNFIAPSLTMLGLVAIIVTRKKLVIKK
ncbi:MAG: hypothetical protein HGN29_04235 [Asgard group archaeon]|nr:hypothetical protein [Asgard group archaeon]